MSNDSAKPGATERFTGLAKVYARGRPTYPAAAIDLIIDRCKLDAHSCLIDVGCGTGISSRLFAERGIQVIGVEPNADMLAQARAHARNDTSHNQQANLQYVEGTAENTNIGAESADAIVCAQAFHWFHPYQSITEFCRVLKRSGWIALMWNERNESDPFTKEYGDLLRTLPDTSKVEMQRGKAGEVLGESRLVRNFSVQWFDNNHIMDFDGLQDRAFSASYVPKEPPFKEMVINGLKRLFAHYSKAGLITMHYKTSVYLAQK